MSKTRKVSGRKGRSKKIQRGGDWPLANGVSAIKSRNRLPEWEQENPYFTKRLSKEEINAMENENNNTKSPVFNTSGAPRNLSFLTRKRLSPNQQAMQQKLASLQPAPQRTAPMAMYNAAVQKVSNTYNKQKEYVSSGQFKANAKTLKNKAVFAVTPGTKVKAVKNYFTPAPTPENQTRKTWGQRLTPGARAYQAVSVAGDVAMMIPRGIGTAFSAVFGSS